VFIFANYLKIIQMIARHEADSAKTYTFFSNNPQIIIPFVVLISKETADVARFNIVFGGSVVYYAQFFFCSLVYYGGQLIKTNPAVEMFR